MILLFDVNYKDRMVVPRRHRWYSRLFRIDLAGEVIESSDDRFNPGDKVIATSYKVGTEFQAVCRNWRIPDWIVPLPDGLTLKESMD